MTTRPAEPSVPSAPSAPLDAQALADRAAALVSGQDGRRTLLGITGAPGAGKSTLTDRLVPALAARLGADAVARVPMDGFHLADAELDRLGRRARKGAPDTFDAAGYVALLERLRGVSGGSASASTPGARGATVYAPAFERTLEQPVAGSIPVGPDVRIVITEGNYLLLDGRDADGAGAAWAGVRGLLDEVWYVDLPEAERLRRLVARHEAFGKSAEAARAWAAGSDQANADLVAAIRQRADLVLVPR